MCRELLLQNKLPCMHGYSVPQSTLLNEWFTLGPVPGIENLKNPEKPGSIRGKNFLKNMTPLFLTIDSSCLTVVGWFSIRRGKSLSLLLFQTWIFFDRLRKWMRLKWPADIWEYFKSRQNCQASQAQLWMDTRLLLKQRTVLEDC